jgi:hypothetical protein
MARHLNSVEASVRMPASFPFRLATRVVATHAVVEWTVGFRDDGPPVVGVVGLHAAYLPSARG